MHLPKDFQVPGVSNRLRFQSTAQMAMADTGAKYDIPGALEAPEERKANLEARKLGNTRTNICFGFGTPAYSTTARSNDDYDRSVVGKMAGGDGGPILTPLEMKKKLAGSNWTFGDELRDFKRASTLANPTGPAFRSYRGVLNTEVADAIKQSSLVFGSVPSSYSTTARETTKMAANDIDYAGDFKRAKDLKKALTTSSMNLDSDEVRGPEVYVSNTHRTMGFDPVAARGAAGQMDESMKRDLRMHHFALGSDTPVYQSDMHSGQQSAARAVEARRAEVLADARAAAVAAGGRAEDVVGHPDLLVMRRNQADVKHLKETLLRTAIVIGDDEDYL